MSEAEPRTTADSPIIEYASLDTKNLHLVRDGTQIDICITPHDAGRPSTPFASETTLTSEPWIFEIVARGSTSIGDVGSPRLQVAELHGLLIKRDLIPSCENNFLHQMISINNFTQTQAQHLFDSKGRLRPKFRSRGISGTRDDSSWVFEVCSIKVAAENRGRGLGGQLVQCTRQQVLAWAESEGRPLLMILLLGATKSDVDDFKAANPTASGAETQKRSSEARLCAKKFWRSLGFRRLSRRSNWFGWTGPEADARRLHTAAYTQEGEEEEWESEHEKDQINAHDDDMDPDVSASWAELERENGALQAGKALTGRCGDVGPVTKRVEDRPASGCLIEESVAA